MEFSAPDQKSEAPVCSTCLGGEYPPKGGDSELEDLELSPKPGWVCGPPVKVLVPTCGGADAGLEESSLCGDPPCPAREIMGLPRSRGLDRGLTLQPLSQGCLGWGPADAHSEALSPG